MRNNESENNYQRNKNVEQACDLTYLQEMTKGKKHLIKSIMDVFLKQIPEELQSINNAINKSNYLVIKNYTHTMRSSVSIMGIFSLIPILKKMEELSVVAKDLDKIKELNRQLNLICNTAIEELRKRKSIMFRH